MALKTLEPKNHRPHEEVRHDLKSTLTALSLKIQLAQKLLSKGRLSELEAAAAIKILSNTQMHINELSKKIDEEF